MGSRISGLEFDDREVQNESGNLKNYYSSGVAASVKA
jgi:hypothetical protein